MSFSTSPHWESDLWTFWLPVGFSQAETIRKGVFSVFTAALLIVVKTCKRCNCPSTDEWIKMWYIYTMGYYSAIKKRKWCHLQQPGWTRDYRTKWNVIKRKTNIIWYHLYVQSKIWHKWTYLWNRSRPTDRESRLVAAKVGVWASERKRLGIWD